MAGEAHRLQDHAGYETEIAIALGQRQFDKQHMVKVIETDDEGDGDDESSDDPVPGYDVSTPQLCERLIQQTAVSPDKGKKTFTPKDPHDATVQLALFRPVCHGVAALRTLLEARADPNIEPGPGDISPLRSVMCFARSGEVQEMRKLLLDHGAKETKDDKKRWELREYTDKNERAWLMRFHRDDREV